mmetsp:Transcript_12641/g.37118  ORF Transcript_12641/g.37118 Transcript_12641/m.37118 type:complete len:222 (-) Transcript_12641:668-1333(-)
MCATHLGRPGRSKGNSRLESTLARGSEGGRLLNGRGPPRPSRSLHELDLALLEQLADVELLGARVVIRLLEEVLDEPAEDTLVPRLEVLKVVLGLARLEAVEADKHDLLDLAGVEELAEESDRRHAGREVLSPWELDGGRESLVPRGGKEDGGGDVPEHAAHVHRDDTGGREEAQHEVHRREHARVGEHREHRDGLRVCSHGPAALRLHVGHVARREEVRV